MTRTDAHRGVEVGENKSPICLTEIYLICRPEVLGFFSGQRVSYSSVSCNTRGPFKYSLTKNVIS